MKKIALISTFCDTKEKQDILYKNILKIKELGIDVMALGPNFIQLPSHITEACDYFFYTKDNPLLEWPTRAYTHWHRHIHSPSKVLEMHRGLADYGWAALFQTKKLSQLALTFDYDVFIHLIYDIEIDEPVSQEFLSNEVNIIHPRINPKNPNDIWDTTLHLMRFDRDMMEKIEQEITLKEYLGTNGMAEGEVMKWREKFQLKTSKVIVKDLIFYWGDFDFFNQSPFTEFKMFISKNDPAITWLGDPPIESMLTENLRIVFHGITDMGEIKIKINGVEYIETPKNFEFIEFPISSKNVDELIFEYNNKVVDYTETYSGIMRNLIYYNTK